MNDDISLIGHMSGQGEAAADKLRQAGYTTLQKIIEEKPSVLAESTGLEPSIVRKIINSAKSLGGGRPVAKTKVKKKAKKKTAKAPSRKKVQRPKVTAKKKVAKKTKKSSAKPKKVIAERPTIEPQRRVANSLAAKHEIEERTAIRFVDAVKRTPGIKEKILKEVMARDKFRERLARHLARKLT